MTLSGTSMVLGGASMMSLVHLWRCVVHPWSYVVGPWSYVVGPWCYIVHRDFMKSCIHDVMWCIHDDIHDVCGASMTLCGASMTLYGASMVLGGDEHFMMLWNRATMTLWRQAQTGLSIKTCRDAGPIDCWLACSDCSVHSDCWDRSASLTGPWVQESKSRRARADPGVTLHSTQGHCHPHNFTQYTGTLSPALHMDTVTHISLYTLHMDTVTHITLHSTQRHCHPHYTWTLSPT